MRFTFIETEGIPGLGSGRVTIPDLPLVAVAGPNGSGKSTLLSALLTPVMGRHPVPHPGELARVTVGIELTSRERSALEVEAAAREHIYSQVPEFVELSTSAGPNTNTQTAVPDVQILRDGFHYPSLGEAEPSLNTLYLPAFRRLGGSGDQRLDLERVSPNSNRLFVQQSRERAGSGTLDDSEFEDYAKALFTQSLMPEGDDPDFTPASPTWADLVDAVNTVISPKQMLGFTRSKLNRVRISTPEGREHFAGQLSSGEQQALLLMTHVIRGRAHGATVIIDEPDVHLHPRLCSRLVRALQMNNGPGHLIIATHSPAMLDLIPPEGIIRLEQGHGPTILADEPGRLEMYRSLGARASLLTQNDGFVFVEGPTDVALLSAVCPEVVSTAGLLPCGGRSSVISRIRHLRQFNLPVCGAIDGDGYEQLETAGQVGDLSIVEWSSADIEGVFLSDRNALQAMIDAGLAAAGFCEVTALQQEIQSLCEGRREHVLTELAMRTLRVGSGAHWPSPNAGEPLERLREMASLDLNIRPQEIEAAIDAASNRWNAASGNLLRLVRGKAIVNEFAERCSVLTSGEELLRRIAQTGPRIAEFEKLERLVADLNTGSIQE